MNNYFNCSLLNQTSYQTVQSLCTLKAIVMISQASLTFTMRPSLLHCPCAAIAGSSSNLFSHQMANQSMTLKPSWEKSPTWCTRSSATSTWLLRAARCKAVYPSSFFSSTIHGRGNLDSNTRIALKYIGRDGIRAFVKYLLNDNGTRVKATFICRTTK